MATSNSNARLTHLENGTVLQTFSPIVTLTYSPNGIPGVASFSCTDYMVAGNNYYSVNSQPKTTIVNLKDSLSVCYGSQKSTLVDPVTGADLTQLSVAGLLLIFQVAFDAECNKQFLENQLKVSNTEMVSFTYTSNGSSIQFSSNTGNIQAVTWGWLFGDGTYSLNSDPIHKYIVPGNVSASFIAIDANNNIYSNTQIIEVS